MQGSATPLPTLTSALQDTFHRIETLGSAPAFGGMSSYRAVPLPPSSRVTDSVFGNPMHDIHKIRVPSVIHEDLVKSGAGSAGSSSQTGAQKSGGIRKYVIGIIVVGLLLVVVIFAMLFIRRRNNKRVREEAELAEIAEEQFKQRMLEQHSSRTGNNALHRDEDDAVGGRVLAVAVSPTIPTKSQDLDHAQLPYSPPPPPSPPPPSPQTSPVQAPPPRPQIQTPPPPPPRPQPTSPRIVEVQQEEQHSDPILDTRIQASTKLVAHSQIQAPVRVQTPVRPPPPSPSPSPSPVQPNFPETSTWDIKTFTSDESEEPAEIEAMVAKTLQTRRRLEELRHQLDTGIQNVVGNVSDSVAKTIASQRAFSSHSSDQEYDEKVLLNTGTPNIATTPLDDTALPSINLLDTVADEHPEQGVPLGENSN